MEKVLREVAKELLEETDLLKDRGFFSCHELRDRAKHRGVNAFKVEILIDRLGEKFVERIRARKSGVDIAEFAYRRNENRSYVGAFVHAYSYVYEDEINVNTLFEIRKAWLKFVVESEY
ncbi:hypothetical protein VPFG_00233 [Vibrio phage nt-1]|uniref:Uncharacterized protein n=1 Tax=Vibrio phage nt-1 TaxID=115992 RepID=R9TJG3_9CAUD|nr:hypothetical protein VPFG_00233 [Vibrio phage nt-1]AGN30232.1 hypothetical protein VPFG_00233 [Vibrio phage nt-1]